MKVRRKPLQIRSEEYSRECGIPRSLGCHVSQVIERIVAREERKSNDTFSEDELGDLAKVGFMFERAMSAHAKVVVVDNDYTYEQAQVAERVSKAQHASNLIFPGEQFWCITCDSVMPGGRAAQEHCRTYKGHRGIFFTVDGMIASPWSVKEWKYTHLSSRRTGEDHIDGIPKWKYQTMFYCDMMDTVLADMEVAFARGDYSSFKPRVELYEFEIEYTKQELAKNRTMIVSNARAEGLL